MDCGIVAKLAQGDWGTKLRVGTALTLLIGAKVGTPIPDSNLINLTRYLPGPQCRSSLLLQEYRRLDEHRFHNRGWHRIHCGRVDDYSL